MSFSFFVSVLRGPELPPALYLIIEIYDIQVERKHAQAFGSIPQRLWRFQGRHNLLGFSKDDAKRKIANGHFTYECLSCVPVARASKIPPCLVRWVITFEVWKISRQVWENSNADLSRTFSTIMIISLIQRSGINGIKPLR